ncbi:flagellar filament capping protein FliD [Thiohalorhabdus methylotrophus]|uniref:Flagellar hook-associated protein 2 n=1 Tax=Thiohalorhabdus methylotrophus TaxID=3242694 RepID=A0ABV4TW00_9GAMM
MPATGSISQLGIKSGIGKQTVDKLVNARSGQLKRLNQDKGEAEQDKKLFQKLNSQLKGLLDAARALNEAKTYQSRKASSSDQEVVKVSAGKEAEPGSHSLNVSARATAHSQIMGVGGGSGQDAAEPGSGDSGGVTKGIAATGDAKAINDGVTVSFFHEGKEYSHTTDAETTLASLAKAVDEEDNGVEARVANIDGTGKDPQYVLTLKSQSTGAGTHQITTDAEGGSPGIATSGGSLFAAGDKQEQAQEGQNAQFTVDGISYTRATNEVDDALTGVTLNLQAAGEATIDVTHNTSAAGEKMQAFVDAYNKVDDFLQKNMAYDAQNQQASPLTGDATARGVERRLRSMVGQFLETEDLQTSIQTLTEVGVRIQRDGSLSLEKTDFEEKLESNPEGVRAFFVGDGRMADRLVKDLEGLTGTGTGVVPSKIDSLEDSLDRFGNEIDAERRDLQEYRERMTEKYAELDKVMASFEGKKSQLKAAQQQIANL